jgi:hypothetical protein
VKVHVEFISQTLGVRRSQQQQTQSILQFQIEFHTINNIDKENDKDK